MGSKNRVLVWVVDDADSVRQSLAAVLETADIQVQGYPSAKAFLDDFEPDSTGCLIVDHHMPDMTGLELLQHLRVRDTKIPTIFITGRGDAAMTENALKAGAIAVLNKPVDGDELITLIESVMLNNK